MLTALSPSEQRSLLREVREIKKLLTMGGITPKWVDMNEAKAITGLGRSSIIAKSTDGEFNISKTGKKTQYYRPDLEKYRLNNSTLKQ